MEYLSRYRSLLLLFGLALVMRLVFALPIITQPDFSGLTIAYDGYYEIAENLLASNGFTRSTSPPYAPDSVRTPVYPLIIAAVIYVTGSYKALVLLQVLIGSLIPLLGRKIAELMTGHSGIALGVGIFLAVEPFTAWVSSAIFTEVFFTFSFLLSFILFLAFLENRKTATILWCALLLGVATLIKPSSQFLPVIFCAVLIFKEWRPTARLLGQLAIFFLVFLLTLAPWMYRNYIVFGDPNLNVQTVSALYAYLVPSSIALEQGTTWDVAAAEFFAREGVTSIEDVNLGNQAVFLKRALAELSLHPVGFVKSVIVTGLTFFTHDGYRTFTGDYALLAFSAPGVTAADIARSPSSTLSLFSYPGVILIGLGRLMWILLSVLMLAGAYLWLIQKRFSTDSLVIVLTILYFAATTTIIGLSVNGRFRNPINAFIVTLAFLACFHFMRYYRSRT